MKNLILLPVLLFAFVAPGQSWDIADVDVIQDGATLANPWTGGLSAPQFWPIDFDDDGIDDMMVFDRVGNRMMMFKTSLAGDDVTHTFNYAWERTFPSLIEFVIPRDYTGDGVPDLFTYANNGIPGIQVYRGSRDGGDLTFELVDLDQDFPNAVTYQLGSQLFNIGINRIDLPNVVDVNGDGDLDILSFPSSGGTIHYYENQQVELDLPFDQLRYRLEEDCFGGFFESDFSEEIFLASEPGICAQEESDRVSIRHNGSTTLSWDRDGDGDLDLLVGDFTSDRLVSIDMDVVGEVYHAIGQDTRFPSYSQSVDLSTFLSSYLFDVDLDGDDDLLVAPTLRNASVKKNNILLYENVGTDSFDLQYRTDNFLAETMIDFGLKTAPTFMDVDADGWMDIIVGSETERSVPGSDLATLAYYRHSGDPDQVTYTLVDDNWLNFNQYANESRAFAPSVADMDSDGDMDLIIGDQTGQLFYVENTAGPGAPFAAGRGIDYPWMDIDAGQYAVPATYDVNGDGLLDLIIGERNANNDPMTNMICGTVNYFENIGTSTLPSFISDQGTSPNSECLGRINTRYNNTIQGMSAPTVYVTTQDEPLLFLGTDQGFLVRYEMGAVGETWTLIDSIAGGVDIGAQSKPSFADIDADGRLEMVLGGQGGGLMLFDTPIRTDGTVSSTNLEPSHTENIELFPNPARPGDRIALHTDSRVDQITIYTLDGRQAFRQDEGGSFVLPALSSGVYVVHLGVERQIVVAKLLVL